MEYIKEIYAQYDKHCIRIYQAYNQSIAEEAIKLQTFGNNFNVNRMTWIKPSFLWMMYRSNWGTKKNQEYIVNAYAHWEANTYTVVFDKNGGSGSQMPNQKFTYGQSQKLNENSLKR